MDIIPQAALNIDINWKQWFDALIRCAAVTKSPEYYINKIESYFSPVDDVIVTMCVRTLFDLYLTVKNFPKGSEVIMTAINIPDMVNIVLLHGLKPVPVDVDIGTLQPELKDLEAEVTDQTWLILLGMVFGVRYDASPICEMADRYNIPVIEDCAESFVGPSYVGCPEAEMTFFSFGPIKTNTAFGGGVAIVRDPTALAEMRVIHSKYPRQDGKILLKKLFQYSIGMLWLNNRFWNKAVRVSARFSGFDYKKFVVGMMRGFPPQKDFLGKFRFQPSVPLLSFLSLRLHTFDEEANDQLDQPLFEAQETLLANGIICPGHRCETRSFWLFPIYVKNVNKSFKRYNEAGIDAYQGVTQLDVVYPPLGSGYTAPQKVIKAFRGMLYLPIHKAVPEHEIKEIVARVIEQKNLIETEELPKL